MRYRNVLYPDFIYGPKRGRRAAQKKGWRKINRPSVSTILSAGLIVLAVVLLGLSFNRTSKGIKANTEEAMAFIPVQNADQFSILGTYSVDSGGTYSSATIETAPFGDLTVTIYSEFEPQVLHARLLEDSILDVDRIGLGSISVQPKTGTVKISFKDNGGTQLCEFYR